MDTADPLAHRTLVLTCVNVVGHDILPDESKDENKDPKIYCSSQNTAQTEHLVGRQSAVSCPAAPLPAQSDTLSAGKINGEAVIKGLQRFSRSLSVKSSINNPSLAYDPSPALTARTAHHTSLGEQQHLFGQM